MKANLINGSMFKNIRKKNNFKHRNKIIDF
jgi:hypothetical protein